MVTLLAPVLGLFEESVDAVDLQAARTLLDELTEPVIAAEGRVSTKSADALAIPRRRCAVTPRWAFRFGVPYASVRFLLT